MNIALLLSGGVGSRLKSDVPKQYIRMKGKMLITYALETLIHSSYIDEVQIVAEYGWRKGIMEDCEKQGIRTEKITGFAIPGVSRQASILNGLQNIIRERNGQTDIENMEENDTVLVHDAARPLLTIKQIEDCFTMLSEGHDGVMPVLPMKDTVYLSRDGNRVSELMNRKELFAGQAPELFKLKKYYHATMNLTLDRLNRIKGSTEPAIIAGMDIAIIPGDENNFKITTQADFERFCWIINKKE